MTSASASDRQPPSRPLGSDNTSNTIGNDQEVAMSIFAPTTTPLEPFDSMEAHIEQAFACEFALSDAEWDALTSMGLRERVEDYNDEFVQLMDEITALAIERSERLMHERPALLARVDDLLNP